MRKIIKTKFLYLLGIFSVYFITSCNNNNQEEDNNNIEEKVKNELENSEQNKKGEQIYYQIPSPDEMFKFIKEAGEDFKSGILNPAENVTKYTDTRIKSLVFGIYTADLAYSAAFEQYQLSITYFNALRKLSDEIGVTAAFDERLVNRIQNNLENADSLLTISSSSYYKIIDQLEKDQRGPTLSLMLTGGWLESVYIATNLVPVYSDNNLTINRIVDQKFTLENILAYLDKFKDKENVKITINELQKLKSVYDKIKEEDKGESELKEKNGKRILGGGTELKIDAETYKLLKEAINNLRSNYVNINNN